MELVTYNSDLDMEQKYAWLGLIGQCRSISHIGDVHFYAQATLTSKLVKRQK